MVPSLPVVRSVDDIVRREYILQEPLAKEPGENPLKYLKLVYASAAENTLDASKSVGLGTSCSSPPDVERPFRASVLKTSDSDREVSRPIASPNCKQLSHPFLRVITGRKY